MGVCTGISARSSVSEKSLEPRRHLRVSAVRFPKRGMLPRPDDIDAKFQTHHDPYAPDSMWFVAWLACATVIRVPVLNGATVNNALTLEDQSGHRLAMKKPGGWGTGFTEKAWVGPATKKPGLRTGLLQLDAIQTSRRPTCGERGANKLPLPATRTAKRAIQSLVPEQHKK